MKMRKTIALTHLRDLRRDLAEASAHADIALKFAQADQNWDKVEDHAAEANAILEEVISILRGYEQ